jgi:S1-C subfamily serine protease
MRWCLAAALAIALAACGDDGPPADSQSVAIRVSGCAVTDEVATGVVVGDDLVLTVGHVLRRAERVSVDGREGAVVAIDRRLDAALIAVPTTGSVVAIAADVAVGPATIEGSPVFVRQLVSADVEEPRDATRYVRQALVVEAESSRGDSGSPVVALDGSLLGMVFASSTRDPGVTYAVSAVELAPFVASATATDRPVRLSCI